MWLLRFYLMWRHPAFSSRFMLRIYRAVTSASCELSTLLDWTFFLSCDSSELKGILLVLLLLIMVMLDLSLFSIFVWCSFLLDSAIDPKLLPLASENLILGLLIIWGLGYFSYIFFIFTSSFPSIISISSLISDFISLFL
jgi:hypothetical protein